MPEQGGGGNGGATEAQLTTDKLALCNPSDAITYTSVKISAW